jgi:hypothetical protein
MVEKYIDEPVFVGSFPKTGILFDTDILLHETAWKKLIQTTLSSRFLDLNKHL